MRFAALALALLTCAACGPSPLPSGYLVEASGAPAVVDRSWTLRSGGASIGIILAVASCGDLLFAADTQGAVRRLDLATGETLPPLEVGLAMAFAADCDARLIHVLTPRPLRSGSPGLTIRSIEIDTAKPRATAEVEASFMPGGQALVDGNHVLFAGLLTASFGPGYRHPPAQTFFSDKAVGLRVDVSTGVAEPMFQPFELACRGAGACAGGSLARGREGEWLVTQPTVPEVGVYRRDGSFARRLDVRSPMLLDDGVVVEALDAVERTRWSTSNSLMRAAELFDGDTIAAVHYLTSVPDGWTFGEIVQMDAWMNLVSLDGRKLVSDIRLPGFPVGRDETGFFVVDYGAEGRQGAHDAITIAHVPVRGAAAY